MKILNTKYYLGSTARGYDLRAYDVSADGTRFLMVKDVVTSLPRKSRSSSTGSRS